MSIAFTFKTSQQNLQKMSLSMANAKMRTTKQRALMQQLCNLEDHWLTSGSLLKKEMWTVVECLIDNGKNLKPPKEKKLLE